MRTSYRYRRHRRRARQQLATKAALAGCVLLYVAWRAWVAWYRIHRVEVLHTVAWVGPLLLALVLGVLALLVRAGIRNRVRYTVGPATLAAIAPPPGVRSTGRQFEELIADVLRRDGAVDVQVVGGARDRGADVIGRLLLRTRRWFGARRLAKVVVQCKHYAEGESIDSKEMQAFLGTVRLIHRADVAVFATTAGRFTREATELAAAGRVVLVAAPELLAILAGQRPLVPASVIAPATPSAGADLIGEAVA